MARFGSIGKQYFDNSGYPLISGKLYFYESGTSTLKTTYADVNLSIPNTNPVILSAAGRQPNVFFNGSAKVVLTDSNTVQIEVRDPDGETEGGNFQQWNSITVYTRASIVVSDSGKYYISKDNGNDGNNPDTSPQYWQEVEFISVWNSFQVYGEGATVKGSDGLFYISRIPLNSGNNPVSSPTEWGPPIEIPPAVNSAGVLYSFDNFFGF